MTRAGPLLCALILAACEPAELMPGDQTALVDQGFKSTIAAVEIHRLRHGDYSESLDDLSFTGERLPCSASSYATAGSATVMKSGGMQTPPISSLIPICSGLSLVQTHVGRQDAKL